MSAGPVTAGETNDDPQLAVLPRPKLVGTLVARPKAGADEAGAPNEDIPVEAVLPKLAPKVDGPDAFPTPEKIGEIGRAHV